MNYKNSMMKAFLVIKMINIVISAIITVVTVLMVIFSILSFIDKPERIAIYDDEVDPLTGELKR